MLTVRVLLLCQVDCPIHVMRGDTDLVTRVYPMKYGWSKHTTAGVSLPSQPLSNMPYPN
jgi:surfactin synthase thioesterase subunit